MADRFFNLKYGIESWGRKSGIFARLMRVTLKISRGENERANGALRAEPKSSTTPDRGMPNYIPRDYHRISHSYLQLLHNPFLPSKWKSIREGLYADDIKIDPSSWLGSLHQWEELRIYGLG